MIFPERIRQLRKSKGWSQQELAKKIEGDARKISQYENGKVTPSAEMIMKLAEIFEISIDYLLIKDAVHYRPSQKEQESLKDLQLLNELDDEDKKAVRKILEGLSKQSQLKKVFNKKN